MYYKDDTHYFVMTAKKQCLLRLGVLRQVRPGPGREGLGGWPWEVEARLGQFVTPTQPWVCPDLSSTSTSSSPLRFTWQPESYSGLKTLHQPQDYKCKLHEGRGFVSISFAG